VRWGGSIIDTAAAAAAAAAAAGGAQAVVVEAVRGAFATVAAHTCKRQVGAGVLLGYAKRGEVGQWRVGCWQGGRGGGRGGGVRGLREVRQS